MPAQYSRAQVDAVFDSRVDRSGGPDACWPWRGVIAPNGYGHFQIAKTHLGVSGLAHRYAYERAYGTLAPGTCTLHRCDVRCCVNPAHLVAGSHVENARDMVAKRRHYSVARPDRAPRGERNIKAKLTSADVRSIRAAYDAGESPTVLAARFACTVATVCKVGKRQTWKHLD